MAFKPEHKEKVFALPYFEDLSGTISTGHRTEKSRKELLSEIHQELALMDGTVLSTTLGSDEEGGALRYGYLIDFLIYGSRGRIALLAYPLKNETASKKEQALRHVLFVARDYFKSMRMIKQMSSVNPLIAYTLTQGDITIMQEVSNKVLALPSGNGAG